MSRAFFRRLEQRADVHIKTDVGKCGGDHFGAAVMTVLTELHHQHARPAALLVGEGFDVLLDPHEVLISLVGGAIDAGDRVNHGAVALVNLLEGIGNLTNTGAHASGIDREVQQVTAAVLSSCGERIQRGLAGLFVTVRPHFSAGVRPAIRARPCYQC